MTRPANHRRAHLVPIALLNLIYASALTALALNPSPPRLGGTDWMLHGLAFGVQATLLHWLLRRVLSPQRALAVAAAGAAAYGLAIELLQLSVPGRFFQLSDLVANGGGIAIAAASLAVVEWLLRRSRSEGAA